MEDKKIAKLIAEMCYYPKKKESREFAVQLFFERLMHESIDKSYTLEDMEEAIKGFMYVKL